MQRPLLALRQHVPQDCAGAVARSPASWASDRNRSTEQRDTGRRKESAGAGGSRYEKSRMPQRPPSQGGRRDGEVSGSVRPATPDFRGHHGKLATGGCAGRSGAGRERSAWCRRNSGEAKRHERARGNYNTHPAEPRLLFRDPTQVVLEPMSLMIPLANAAAIAGGSTGASRLGISLPGHAEFLRRSGRRHW